jgi:hypothetical protein
MLNKLTKTTKEVADELMEAIKFGEINPEEKAFYSKLKSKGCWGEDEGGVYFRHPDGRKEYEA